MKFRVVDLFSGMGGLRAGVVEGLTESGHTVEVVFTSEIKPAAVKVLNANYPRELITGDITKVKTENVPDHDLLLAGFPCQAFSYAGNRAGFSDPTRGTLFFDVARILRSKRPSYFILENVEGLLTHNKKKDSPTPHGRTLETILTVLKRIGYKVTYKVLDSSFYGSPQARRRVFIVGSLYDTPETPQALTKPLGIGTVLEENVVERDPKVNAFCDLLLQTYTPEELLGKVIRDKRNGSNNLHSWNFHYKGQTTPGEQQLLEDIAVQSRRTSWATKKGIKYSESIPLTVEDIKTFHTPTDNIPYFTKLSRLTSLGYLVGDDESGYWIKSGRLSFPITHILDPAKPAPTVVATDANRLGVLTDGRIRRLTLVELKRLFGFPEEYILPTSLTNTQIFDLFGNSVVVPVASAVVRSLVK